MESKNITIDPIVMNNSSTQVPHVESHSYQLLFQIWLSHSVI